MSTYRQLSGLYFRHQNELGVWENVCFEDLPESEQEKILGSKEPEFIRSMVLALAKTIRRIGDELDIAAN